MFNLHICTAAPISSEQDILDKVKKTLDLIKDYTFEFEYNGKSLSAYIDEFKNAQAAGDTKDKETALTEAIVALINSAVPTEIMESINEIINIPETLKNQIFELITKTFEKIKFNELDDMNIEKIIELYSPEAEKIKPAISRSKNNQYDILTVIAHDIIDKNKTTNSAIKKNTTTNDLSNLFNKYRECKDQQADIKRLANEEAKKLADEAAAEAQRLLEAKKSTDEATKNPTSKIKIGIGVIGVILISGGLYSFVLSKPTGEYDEYEYEYKYEYEGYVY